MVRLSYALMVSQTWSTLLASSGWMTHNPHTSSTYPSTASSGHSTAMMRPGGSGCRLRYSSKVSTIRSRCSWPPLASQ